MSVDEKDDEERAVPTATFIMFVDEKDDKERAAIGITEADTRKSDCHIHHVRG